MARTPMSQVIPYASGTTFTAAMLDQICGNLALQSDMALLQAAIIASGSNVQVVGTLNVSTTAAASGALTVNSSGTGLSTLTANSSAVSSLSVIANNSGAPSSGIPSGAVGIATGGSSQPIVVAILGVEKARLDPTSSALLVGNSPADRGLVGNGLVKVSANDASILLYPPTGTSTRSWAGRITAGPSSDNLCGPVLQAPTTSGGIIAGSETYADVLRLSFSTLSGFTSGVERWRTDSAGHFLVGYTASNGAFPLQVNGQIFATSATIATSDQKFKTNVVPIASALGLVCALQPVEFDYLPDEVHNFPSGRQIGFIAQEVQTALAGSDYIDALVYENNRAAQPAVEARDAVPEQPAVLDDDGTVVTPEVPSQPAVAAQPAVPADSFLGLADAGFTPLVVKALQELAAQVTALQATVASQAEAIAALQAGA